MATSVVFDGVTYFVPAFGDTGYAQGPGNMSAYWIAIASGSFQHTAGSFPLTAQANFGTSFGLTALNFTSTTANPATAGVLRLAKTDAIDWRNNANGANLPLAINGSDQLTFNGIVISTASVGGTVNTGTVGRLTLYPATGNTVDDVYTQNAFGIDVLIAAQAARSVALEYTIPNPGNAVATATFALLELAQTFTAAQTFSTAVTISATTNQLVLGVTNTTTITSPAPAASRTYTIPDSGGAASFVMTAGTQTIGGAKTFSSAVTVNPTTNQIVLGVTNTTTISSTAPAASRTVTLPDAGANSSFVLTQGTQTIAGQTTLSNVAGNPVHGTNTNDSAAAGFIGEYIESVTTSATPAATTVYNDATSISLTAGDWDISILFDFISNGATWTTFICGVGTVAGNDATNISVGDSAAAFTIGSSSTSVTRISLVVPSYRRSISGTTTFYLKANTTYSAGTPAYNRARISARRVR